MPARFYGLVTWTRRAQPTAPQKPRIVINDDHRARDPPTSTPSPIDIAGGRGGIFSGVFKPECAEALFQPRIQAFLTAPIEQFGKYRIHERFEMVRVTYGRAPKCVPDVGKFAVFDAVETNIGHPARLLRSM